MKDVKSYGIIPIYKDGKDHYIPIVKNQGGHFGLPKGTPEDGEKPVETAKRELFEETGVMVNAVEPDKFFEEKYSFENDGIKYNKTNIFYISFVGGMNDAKWLKLDDAIEMLTHETAKQVVLELIEYLK
jgi:8-oxo-dGTP pyrophosphatase MutT (NUDIX family)